MHFEIVGKIEEVRLIARGPSLRERRRLQHQFGRGRWRKLKGVATIRLPSGLLCRAELHWYEAHGIGRRKLKDQAISGLAMGEAKRRYVICLRNGGAEDLEPRKLYEVIQDEVSERRGHLRVLDESGEDYLYPRELFAAVDVPDDAERALKA